MIWLCIVCTFVYISAFFRVRTTRLVNVSRSTHDCWNEWATLHCQAKEFLFLFCFCFDIYFSPGGGGSSGSSLGTFRFRSVEGGSSPDIIVPEILLQLYEVVLSTVSVRRSNEVEYCQWSCILFLTPGVARFWIRFFTTFLVRGRWRRLSMCNRHKHGRQYTRLGALFSFTNTSKMRYMLHDCLDRVKHSTCVWFCENNDSSRYWTNCPLPSNRPTLY